MLVIPAQAGIQRPFFSLEGKSFRCKQRVTSLLVQRSHQETPFLALRLCSRRTASMPPARTAHILCALAGDIAEMLKSVRFHPNAFLPPHVIPAEAVVQLLALPFKGRVGWGWCQSPRS